MSALPPCEISWFSALCDDDYEFLGVPDAHLQSSWAHCRDIVLQAETGGFDNILLPSGYALGIDTTAFAAGIAPLLRRLALLMAVRVGESWPPQLARQIATIDQMLGGRLRVNIISSDMPGETLASAPRYARTVEAMHILKTLLNGEPLDHEALLESATRLQAKRAKRSAVKEAARAKWAQRLLSTAFNPDREESDSEHEPDHKFCEVCGQISLRYYEEDMPEEEARLFDEREDLCVGTRKAGGDAALIWTRGKQAKGRRWRLQCLGTGCLPPAAVWLPSHVPRGCAGCSRVRPSGCLTRLIGWTRRRRRPLRYVRATRR